MSESMPAHSRAVAPPGRRLRALRRAGSIPVRWWSAAAARRRVEVMVVGRVKSKGPPGRP
jgi:hypothetical protein